MKSKQKTGLAVVRSREICYKSDKDAEVPKRTLSGSIHLPQGGNNCFGGGQCRALKSPLNSINLIKMWSIISPGESDFTSTTRVQKREDTGRSRKRNARLPERAAPVPMLPSGPLLPARARGKHSAQCTRWRSPPQQAFLHPSVLS